MISYAGSVDAAYGMMRAHRAARARMVISKGCGYKHGLPVKAGAMPAGRTTAGTYTYNGMPRIRQV